MTIVAQYSRAPDCNMYSDRIRTATFIMGIGKIWVLIPSIVHNDLITEKTTVIRGERPNLTHRLMWYKNTERNEG